VDRKKTKAYTMKPDITDTGIATASYQVLLLVNNVYNMDSTCFLFFYPSQAL
jgi:hypothetical protein